MCMLRSAQRERSGLRRLRAERGRGRDEVEHERNPAGLRGLANPNRPRPGGRCMLLCVQMF